MSATMTTQRRSQPRYSNIVSSDPSYVYFSYNSLLPSPGVSGRVGQSAAQFQDQDLVQILLHLRISSDPKELPVCL